VLSGRFAVPIDAMPDHVAAAVPDIDAAHARWRDRLGGGDRASDGPYLGFRNWQYRFRGGAALELLEGGDAPTAGFVQRFLDRFGSGVHHVTLIVEDLAGALDVLAAADLDVVDVNLADDRWQEAFVRPRVVGGLIVQVAATTLTDDDWAELTNFTPTDPAPDGAVLLGPLLEHPDLDRARHVWSTLGGTVETIDDRALEVTWADAPLSVRVRHGDTAGPVGLRFAGAQALPADPALGPAVLPG
jgi:catechol 2,3-dioxygenase-like lactoylglutathione lyase family enzyme